jgi:hypothetical protein
VAVSAADLAGCEIYVHLATPAAEVERVVSVMGATRHVVAEVRAGVAYVTAVLRVADGVA